MKVLVTGAAGFVGGRLAASLLAGGTEVCGIDSITDYYARSIKQSTLESLREQGAEVTIADLNTVELEPLLNVDAVFHLAGQPGVRKSWGADFVSYTRDNVLATQRLLEAVKRYAPHARFVYSSSSSVYGSAERFPTTEDTRPQPKSPYGVTKLAGEHLASLYAENYGLRTVSLRYFTVYGPRQRPDMAFTRFIGAALRGREIVVFGTGEQVRDFTYVDDIVDANISVALETSSVEPGEVFNVSGGSEVSVNGVLGELENLIGRKLSVRHEGVVAGDVARTGGDSARLRDATGWAPRTALGGGLAAQVEWMDGELSAANSAWPEALGI